MRDLTHQKEYKKQYYQDHKEEIKKKQNERRKNNPEKYRVIGKKSMEKNSHKYKEKKKISEYKRNLYYRLKTLYKISEFHGTSVKCWKCGENRIFCLTIGHFENNGREDRLKNGHGPTYYKKIVEEIISCEHLKIECYNCNMCAGFNGKYPDELTHDTYINGDKYGKHT